MEIKCRPGAGEIEKSAVHAFHNCQDVLETQFNLKTRRNIVLDAQGFVGASASSSVIARLAKDPKVAATLIVTLRDFERAALALDALSGTGRIDYWNTETYKRGDSPKGNHLLSKSVELRIIDFLKPKDEPGHRYSAPRGAERIGISTSL